MKGITSVDQLEVGKLFTITGKDVWVVESFCEHPTVTLRNLSTGEHLGGAVGSLNVSNFVPLVPEEKVDGKSV